jgi:hypothetical protein
MIIALASHFKASLLLRPRVVSRRLGDAHDLFSMANFQPFRWRLAEQSAGRHRKRTLEARGAFNRRAAYFTWRSGLCES